MDGVVVSMQKKKVLFVIHQLTYGGAQKSLVEALNAIDYSKNEVTLYVRKDRLQILPKINEKVSRIIVNKDDTHYYRKPYIVCCMLGEYVGKILRRPKLVGRSHEKFVKCYNEMKMSYEREHYFENEEEYDIAVSYIQGYTAQFVAEYVKAKKKILFYHMSTDEVHDIHERIMPQFNTIVGVNKNIQNILANLYPMFANKMTYLENYVDAQEIMVKSQEFEVPKVEGKLNLCTCGRLTPVKGFDLAVEAAKSLKEKNVPFFWRFVGDGSDREKLEKLIDEYELEKDIQITGMKDNPYPYIAGCDVYVQTSREDAHPLTVMEALRLRRPVVSTATVGGDFLVNNKVNGILVDINGEAIAEGIDLLSREKELFENINDYLEQVDYSMAFEKYKQDWKNLLEG